MCECPAHRVLVDCVCQCDHTSDRIMQWKSRALAAEAERDNLRARITGAAIHANRLNTFIVPRSDAWTVLGDLFSALKAPAQATTEETNDEH